MNDTAARGTPLLAGWAMAVAAGLVATAVSMVAMGFDFNQGAFVGIVICVIVGLILGLSWAPAAPVSAPPAKAEPAQFAPAAVEPAASAGVAPLAPQSPTPAAGPVAVAPDAAAPEPAGPVVASRPAALAAARDGGPDDLKRIKGVGPKLEQLCHSLGFYHFDQIANWTAAEIAWVDDNLEGFKGRVSRDEWVRQARVLAAGGDTDFSQRVDDGEVY